MGAPAPHKRLCLGAVVGVIPAHSLYLHIYPHIPKLVGRVCRQGLAYGIAGRVHQRKSCLDAILFPDSVRTSLPSGFLQKFCCLFRVIFCLCRFIIPWHLITHTVGRTSIAVQHMFNHLIPVNGNIDSPSHLYVRRKIISNPGIAARYGPGLHSRQVKSTVIHCLKGKQLISRKGLV